MPCHVQNFAAISSLESEWEENEIPIDHDKNSAVKWDSNVTAVSVIQTRLSLFS